MRRPFRITFLILCIGLVTIPVSTAGYKPNILFILVDDLGWADLAYQGSKVYETPNIDRLAAQGMAFSDFYAGGPVCSPTRASILTGKYTARTGVTTYLLSPERDAAHVTPHLPLEEFTIAEALKKNGYATGYFGKWHLGYKNEHWASNQGFDVAKGGMDLPWAWTLCYPGTEAPTAKTWRKGHTRFFSPHHLTHLENGPEGEYLTDRLTDETIAFIEQERNGPFFAFLSFHTVHTPLQAKPEVVERYRKKIKALGLDNEKESDKREKRFQNLPEYAAMVHHLDENVGHLLDRLDDLKLTNNTIVIFTSDNGGKGSVTSNLPLRGMKHNLYEGGIRVPLIVRWPGKIKESTGNATPLISNDFFPTLLDLASCPPEQEQHLDGISFKPLLTGEGKSVNRETLYWHYPHSRQEAAIRQGRYKLLHRFEKDTVELYDLEDDIGERNDLSRSEPERAARMLAGLRSWQQSVGARHAESTKITKAIPPAEKKPDLTIVAFGDSTTAPRETVDQVYADRLPGLLAAKGIQARVINAGLGGSHTGRLSDNARHKREHALDRFESAVRSHDPDVVIIQFGINDSWVDSGKPGGTSRIPLDAYTRNLRHIIRTLQADKTRVILMTPNDLGKHYVRWRREHLSKYAESVRQIAADLNTELVDVTALFSSHAGGADALLLEGMHPNDSGHELLANAISLRLPKKNTTAARASRASNVLFLAVDDWNDWVGCLGHAQAKTPNVDRLAKRGMLFTNAHCTVSVCNPSRVAIMTGLRPETTGVFENNHRMRRKVPDLVTLPQHFRQNGYRAEGGGKIYHDVPPFCDDPKSWDDYFWWSAHGPKGGKAGGGFRSPYSIPPDPEPEGRPTRKITSLTKSNFDWGPVDQPESHWPDHQVAEWASEFLTKPQEKPFFLAVGIFRPHVPWFNPQKYFDLYPEDKIELPPVVENDVDDLGPWARKRAMDHNSKHDKLVEAGEWKSAVQAYLASISHADANVGRVLDALDQGPHKDNTIIVLWSDHGYHLGEKGHWHKRTLWERATHVPLIVVAPGVTQPGQRSSSPVNLIDLYPTLVELSGLPARAELAGHSLVPLLKDAEAEWSHPSITTYLPGNHAVRTERWRYIRYKDGAEELYDHDEDPNEWRNLAGLDEFAEIQRQLAAQIPTD